MMEELYPKNAIARISKDIKLSQEEIASLTQLTLLEGMQKAVETGLIEVTALICPGKLNAAKNTILFPQEARRLIKLYDAIKDKEVRANKHIKVSDLIFWSVFKDEAHSFIPSPSTAELLLVSPEKISVLREFIQKNAEAFKVWSEIQAEILALNEIPLSQVNILRSKASAISMKLISPKILLPLHNVIRNDITVNEYFMLTTYLSQLINASIDHLENTAKQYFIDYFNKNKKVIENPSTDIVFYPKRNGRQLGRIMKIKYKDSMDNLSKEIQFFIKTHEGDSNHVSSNTHPVDPKEIFIYKVLELIGCGPKVHFYFNQESYVGFYIATQDEGFTKYTGSRYKLFATYEDLKAEFEIKEKDGFDRDTKKGIFYINIISRIFVLRDVATNPTNFGRVTVDKARQKWKIVDFSTPSLASADKFIIDGFKQANGAFYYPEYVKKIVKESSLDEKMTMGAQIIDELERGKPRQNGIGAKLSLEDALNQAFVFVFNYVKKHHKALKIDLVVAIYKLKDINENELMSKVTSLPENKIGEVARYMQYIKQNFSLLAQGIRSYRPENPSLSSVQSGTLASP